MEKQCCNVNCTEIENGFRIEITGPEANEKCKDFLKSFCSEEKIKECLQNCCGSKG